MSKSREELREELLAEAEKDENKIPIKGFSPSAQLKGGKIAVGLERNLAGDEAKWAKPASVTVEVPDFIPEKPKKRTPREQTEALGARLWDSAMKNPQEMELLLKRVQGLLWEQGKPCSYEDVKRLAGELLAVAEKAAVATRS